MPRRLTELAATRMRPVPGKRVECFDGPGGVAGLSLRITERGIKSWALMYRIGGLQRRLTLGRHPDLTLAQARVKARAALDQAARGIDPAGDPGERRPGRDTVGGVCADYVALHVQRNRLRGGDRIERLLRPALAAWGPRPIAAITKRDALDLVDGIAARAPIMANRVQSLLKRVFAWAVDRGILDASPIERLKPPVKERSRDRVLADPELGAIWRASDALGWPWTPIFKLLVLTAARRSEVAGMAWLELDLDRRLWVKPAARTKSGRVHELPLSQATLDLIADLPRISGSDFVFPGRIGGGPTRSFSGAKQRLDRLAGVSGWRIHDLRRTTASGMARVGIAPHVVGAILDHAPAALGGVTAIYNRYSYGPEVQIALERWSEHVARIVAGEPARVVALRPAAG